MDRAVTRLSARSRPQRIAVHGDYDVDGITSTVILRRALEMLGGKVIHFPERLRDGYGLGRHRPAPCRQVDVIVSVDCGIRGMDAARRARELGVDLVITDHHEPDAELPDAVAVVNPKRADCAYPDKHLAGAGVRNSCRPSAARRAWLPGFVDRGFGTSPTSCRSSAKIARWPQSLARPADQPALAAGRLGNDRRDNR
jgi:single-stranded-DNA-specific exonuclease